ncbi:tRNA-splicing ligase RtcB (3'-phosphate/5'-hydroxy nucleic acid ligase) [Nematocida minor]|uniref:tRNA-splicing ligase RtcB (3'-phosphate/5'-hydroxy nucleic acid ligase) n=1 Tax=Nematocida minor TaxID=1912983 RepID=UPI00221F4035|nr:tRNA-splicing ligase RtcB (3'-phosphate/5'-hydroxy nucleic acid ligase) [Nematocida minor]KAI5191214.1 tRNA-splicing ligase RtcB (3'-phosphate/5'-hydroxy nucleic acid ligase) [Nematocida minor]
MNSQLSNGRAAEDVQQEQREQERSSKDMGAANGHCTKSDQAIKEHLTELFDSLPQKSPLRDRIEFTVCESVATISDKTRSDSKKIRLFSPFSYLKHLLDGTEGSMLIDQLLSLLNTPSLMTLHALPDVHAGKVFPVGISCTYSADSPSCAVIPDLIGADINCGVRVWSTAIKKSLFMEKRQRIMDLVAERIKIDVRCSDVPVLGDENDGTAINSSNAQSSAAKGNKSTDCCIDGIGTVNINSVVTEGISYLVRIGLATPSDLSCTEYAGSMPVSSGRVLSAKTKHRGIVQLGTLGSGNHYLEFQSVSKVYNNKTCTDLGLDTDSICISVHTGSRGLGSRAVHEYLSKCHLYRNAATGVCEVPLDSKLAQEYLETVNACSNYAFCNRVIIGKLLEQILLEVFNEDIRMGAISDSVHNVMRLEGNVLTVRKGSTKLGNTSSTAIKGSRDISVSSNNMPSVVSVGGSMSTGSYILEAGPSASMTDYTTCHGSGRIIRRKDVSSTISLADTFSELSTADVLVLAGNADKLPEESSRTYKCIDAVVEYCETVGISNRVCKLVPLSVLKG